ncbi:MAG: hypothetical protein KatS3mg105_4578 [Gemmatales bacterium]|nr:MAG: hypothetical protein KatS3mg105_4578 [Gemmatales bacterium]
MHRQFLIVTLVMACWLVHVNVTCGQNLDPQATLFGGQSLNALAGSFRGFLVEALPTTLLVEEQDWGQTKMVANGLKWHGLRPQVIHKAKNHGVWQRITITTLNLRDSLVFDLRHWRKHPSGAYRFDVFLSFDARIRYDRQRWRRGVRLYAGSTWARLRLKVNLQCEVTSRLEKKKSVAPDVVFRLRVAQANLYYDNLVFEHVAGIGGEAAKILGDALKGSLNRLHPSLEQKLLAKANAAIVKAGDTKEVRISLSQLLGQ